MSYFIQQHRFILAVGLLLFGFSLPLSKSINTILMFCIYGYLIILSIKIRSIWQEYIKNIFKYPLTLPILLFIGTNILGLINSDDLLKGIERVKSISNLLLTYVMLSLTLSIIQKEKMKIYLLFSFITGILFLDFLSIATYFGFISNKKYQIPLSPLNMHHIWFGNLNTLGLYVAISLSMIAKKNNNWIKTLYIILFSIIVLFSIIFSISRTAWIGILGTGFIFVLLIIRDLKTKLIIYLFSISLVISSSLSIPIIHMRLTDAAEDIRLFLSGNVDTSIGARLLMWKISIKMFLSNPIIGVGTGDYNLFLKDCITKGWPHSFLLHYNQPHNMFLFILATNGIIGLFSFLYIFKKIFSISILQKPIQAYSILAIMVSTHYIIGGLSESLMNIHMFICCFSFLIGLSLHSSQKQQSYTKL